MSEVLSRIISQAPLTISGSILAAPSKKRISYAKDLYDSGAWIHIDFIDESYPLSVGVDPGVLKELKVFADRLEVHLMVSDMLQWVRKLVPFHPRRIIVQHSETLNIGNLISMKQLLNRNNIEMWIGANPSDYPEQISEFITQSDGMLQMLSSPGTPNTIADFDILPRLKEIHKPMTVDGGVLLSSLHDISSAGIHNAVAGRNLWKEYLNLENK
ncbi:hypothetical protein OZX67_04615 [Bifidobacterium sp. ESL0728]|uniref:hypothetical protein n=1 Tax=Bifidobacterium sp. ESL0728 TaxID=2983220 RepID=UPI0023F65CF2|nr:hypothetical protein [Bifidobacterium sp. ESL0728]WEV59818.1 hypothetical protein OZX67_04615 [Bifidobacterium sp. ESL0728]